MPIRDSGPAISDSGFGINDQRSLISDSPSVMKDSRGCLEYGREALGIGPVPVVPVPVDEERRRATNPAAHRTLSVGADAVALPSLRQIVRDRLDIDARR